MAWRGYAEWEGGPFHDELACMSWDTLRELAAAGWEIGSHTQSHPMLTELDAVTLREELVESRAECERRLDRQCDSLAYPYGGCDARVAIAAAAAGYRFAVTIPREATAPLPLQWPRVGVYHGDDAARLPRRIRGRSAPVASLMGTSSGRVAIAAARAALRRLR